MRKNVGGQTVGAQLVSKTDGSAVTTGNTEVYVTGDGGTQTIAGASPSLAVHEGNGYWSYPPSQAETNYDHVAFTFVNSSAVNATIQIYPSFPQTGDGFARLGAPAGASVSADVAAVKSDTAAVKTKTDFLPSATAGAAGGVFIAGSNAATSITTALTANVIGNVTGNLSGSVGSVTGAVGSVTGAVGSVTGNVGGNVTGSVGSVATGGIAASSFAAGAIDAAAIATDAIDADAIKADAVTEIQSGLATAAALTTVGSNVTAIKTTTDLLQSMLEVGSGSPTYYRFTVGALELAPTGGAAPSAATIADAVWDEGRAGHVGAGSFGEGVASVQGAVTGSVASVTADVGITQGGADKVWGTAARVLTAGTNIVLAKGVGVTGFNDLDAAGVRTAVGLASANLDTQLDALPTNAELATALGTADDAVLVQVGLVKTVTDKLNTTMESVGSPTAFVFTTAALAQGPSGSGGTPPTAAAIADAVWDEAIAGHLSAGSTGEALDNAGAAGTPPTTAQIADKILGRNLAGGSDGGRMVKDALRSLRNKSSISGGTLTVCEEDDSTPAWTAAVTTTPGDPLSAIDPA